MGQKIILQELCDNLERELNQRQETSVKRTVILSSGLKPSGQYLPQIHVSNHETTDPKFEMEWVVGIYVDGKLIFKESYVPRENEDLVIVEGFLITRVLRNIFIYGVMSSKKFIDENGL